VSGVDSPASRVYANALLEAAAGDAPRVADELDALGRVATESPDTWAALTSPQMRSEDRIAALNTMFEGSAPLTRNFLRVIVDRGRFGDLPGIAAEFRRLVDAAQSQLDVHVTTAIELTPELRTKLEERLSGNTGKQVRLHTSVDPDIIGGLVVQHGDTLVDTSLRGRLDSLRLALTRGSLRPSVQTDQH